MQAVDVLIVGAGPAGCAAAIGLGPHCRVAMIDRHASPPERIGESLPAAARRVLSALLLIDDFIADGHLPRHALRSAWGEAAPVERDLLRDPDGSGWTLDRARFERRLRAAAAARGAMLFAPARFLALSRLGEGWVAEIDRDGRPTTLRARLVLDAGGRASKTLMRHSVRRRVGDRLICAFLRAPRASLPPAVTQIEAEADGWWYATPLPDGGGLLAFHTDGDLPAARTARSSRGFLERARALPMLSAFAEHFASEELEVRVCAAHSAWLERVAGDGWMACGDAALAFDPLAGQGLFNALYTGLAAAKSIAADLNGEAGVIEAYADEIERVLDAYRRHLAAWYALERRWRRSPFWARRSHPSPSDYSSEHAFQ
jgi:flavin-dependent dehydrogenase